MTAVFGCFSASVCQRKPKMTERIAMLLQKIAEKEQPTQAHIHHLAER